jgi:hypothetical protein
MHLSKHFTQNFKSYVYIWGKIEPLRVTMKKLIESLIHLLSSESGDLSTDEKIVFWQKVFWFSLFLLVVVLFAMSKQ